jgi:UDP-N-acetylmuramate dehydrogenase
MSLKSIQKSNLSDLRGRITENALLGETGWFKCGGRAQRLYKPADLEDLQDFLKATSPDESINSFGALSNTIIRDGGLSGTTIRLGRSFADIVVEGDYLRAGAFALDANVAQVAAEAGLGGLEFFSGIPGTIGGALRMNAGCYGTETKDVLVSCRAVDRLGNLHVFTPDNLGMSYRHIDLPEDFIFIDAVFKGKKENVDKVLDRISEIKHKREDSQPIREKTGGSTFANPSPEEIAKAGLPEGTKVWQVIDAIGGRGLKIGGATMSEKHCNFMINTGNATAADLENLGEDIRKRAYEKFGISLRWEIKRMGEKI